MLKRFLAASLAAAMVMGISLTAFADEEVDVPDVSAQETAAQETAEQGSDVGGYNEYGLSYAAIDALTISMDEGTAKYPVTEIIPNDGYTSVIYQNGFTMDYYDDWIDLFTETDEGGKNLFIYFDSTLPSVDAVAALLAEKGYTVIYDYVESADLPVNTCAVDSISGSVKINAGFDEPVYWDIDSEGTGRVSMSYSFNDAQESVE